MLEPDGRVVLIDQLRPPVGYRLEAAIATTFTLHLGAALVPPLAFASHEMRNRPDPIAALEAVRSCTDRVDIFCQAGQIAVPQRASDLMAFLEPMLHPVVRPRPGFLFHPKVWFLWYRSTDLPDKYRLICSTRNLVDSLAWDAAVTLEGVLGNEAQEANEPLSAFLRYLPQWAVTPLPDARRTRVLDLADRASRMRWTPPELVHDVRFHAWGVPGLKPQPDFGGYRHLVVSPFCNDGGVGRVTAGNTRDVTIVSRPEALAGLSAHVLDRLGGPDSRSVLVLDPLAGLLLGSDAETTNGSPDRPIGGSELEGLHAKITIVERNRGEAHVFVGSANATSAAYGDNVEFVVELLGRSKDLGVATMVGEEAPFRDLLQPYQPGGDVEPLLDDEARRKLENLLRYLAALPCSIDVTMGESGYDLHLTSAGALRVPEGHSVQLGLLTSPGMSHFHTSSTPCDALFPGVPLPDVTPFVILRVTDPSGLTLSTVIHAALSNDPPGRLDEVLARQVDSREKFLRFLALLLNLGDPDALWVAGAADAAGAGWSATFGGTTGVFELVLGALADRPESLADLDRLVSRLKQTEAGRDILPDGFDEFWSTVVAALANLAGPS